MNYTKAMNSPEGFDTARLSKLTFCFAGSTIESTRHNDTDSWMAVERRVDSLSQEQIEHIERMLRDCHCDIALYVMSAIQPENQVRV